MTVTNEAQDMLVIQDLMDTLDQLPPELTRVYSDLNELGAVLYSELVESRPLGDKADSASDLAAASVEAQSAY